MHNQNEHCESCHIGMKILTEQEIANALCLLPGWVYNAAEKTLEKEFSFKGYYATIAFVNAVAWIAHQEKHHPDMKVSYNKTVVSYQTHEAGGITRNDLICAAQVDGLVRG